MNNEKKICVRFAPSPTGYLHLGGARTALYNWLFSRQQHGVFILRIEDTDRERSEERFCKEILDDLKWLGLEWDEGPFFQYERKELYLKYAQSIIQNQRAYYCFCSLPETDLPLTSFGSIDPCREIKPQDALRRIASGERAGIRFSTPHAGTTAFKDLIRGQVSFENKELDDFIIVRSNGEPTYNFTVVIDDAMMNITHVIRGDDHLSNTPKQILLYQALGWPCPQFAHIPMIMGPDNTRLSKRHGATAISQYRNMGYVPAALVNYLALLGWAYDDRQTIFFIQELIEKFDLARVNKKAAIFDPKKLDWMNGKYIRQLSDPEFIALAWPYMLKTGWVSEGSLTGGSLPEPTSNLGQILLSVRNNIKKFSELPPMVEFFFQDQIILTEEARQIIYDKEDNLSLLKELCQQLMEMQTLQEQELERLFQETARQREMKLGDLVHPVRAAITGKASSPGLFLTMYLLGKEKVLNRLMAVC